MGNTYSKQLLTTIRNKIGPKLIQFFEKKRKTYSFPVEKMEDLIVSLLNENVKNIIYKEEISIQMRKLNKRRDMRRARWAKSYLEQLEREDYDNVTHPLHYQYETFCKRDESEFFRQTGAYTMEEAGKFAVEECKKWKEDTKGNSIDFPGLFYQSHKTVYAAFRDDVMVDIWRYIDEELDGNINMFMSPYPEMLIGQPIFSPVSFKLDLTQNGDTLQESIRDTENKEVVVLSVNKNQADPGLPIKTEMSNALRTMDETDIKILSVVLASASDVAMDGKNEVVMLLEDLFQKVSSDKRNREYGMERIRSRLAKMVNYSYRITSETKQLDFNFFDHVLQEDTDRGTKLTFRFGSVLYETIIQNKLINITRETFTKLEDPLAKILVYFMQKNRVFTLKDGKTTAKFTYAQIFRAARFPTVNRKKNLAMIANALEDMIRNQSLVRSFEQCGEDFFVEFIPLSEEEKEDLSRNDNGILISETI